MNVPAALAALVKERAEHRCEYCRMSQSLQGATFHIEHILPRSHGGTTHLANLALACPGCGHEWTAPFDIAAYLWEDIEDCARRLLRQVHDIARAYGWTEDTILSLSARRRRMYLEAITGTA